MKNIFLTVICCFIGFIAFSQDTTITTHNAPKFGLLGGLNLSNLTNAENWDDFSYKAGFRAGLFVKLDLNKSFYLNLKPFYSTQGNKNEQQVTEIVGNDITSTTYIDITNKMNYIQLPATLEYRIGSVSFELGPQVGFNIKAKSTIDYGEGKVDADIVNEQTVVVGGTLGVNTYINDKFFIGLAYDRGFTDLFKDVRLSIPEGDVEVIYKYKYSNFSLTLNYIVF